MKKRRLKVERVIRLFPYSQPILHPNQKNKLSQQRLLKSFNQRRMILGGSKAVIR
jgi:hypothetical protein